MKRAVPILFAVLFFTWQGPGLEASMQCMDTRNCKTPPCELMYEIKMAKARLRGLNKGVLAALDETDEQESARYNQALDEEMNNAYRKYAKCPPQKFYQPPPRLIVSLYRDCEILTYPQFKTQSLKEALDGSASCSELVEAVYAGAQARQSRCLAMDANQRHQKKISAAEARELDKAETEAKVKALEASVLQFWNSCTGVMSEATARQMAKVGPDVLRKTPAKKPAKKSAKRAGGAAGRGSR